MTTRTTIARTTPAPATAGLRSAARFVKAHEGERIRVVDTDIVVKASAFDTDGTYEVVVGAAPEGARVTPLPHPWQELYYVLDGAMEVRIGEETRLAAAGDLVVVPADAEHAFTVVTEFARFLNVTMGPRAESATVTSGACRARP